MPEQDVSISSGDITSSVQLSHYVNIITCLRLKCKDRLQTIAVTLMQDVS